MISYLLALVAGFAQPTQTSLNGGVAQKVRSPYVSTLISFSVSFLALIIICLVVEGGLSIPFSDIAAEPLWIWTGGLCGVCIVSLSIICLPHIGSAMTVVMTAFGQILMSLIIDQFGLFNSQLIPMSVTRVVGSVLAVAGVILISYEKHSGDEKYSYSFRYIFLTFLAGLCCGVQIAVNGTLGETAGSPWLGTLINMTVGWTGSLLLIVLIWIFRGRKAVFPIEREVDNFKWYMVLGGTMGVVIVGLNAVTAPVIGTGMVSVINLVGLMSGGLIIDAVGFLGIEVKPVTLQKVVGVVVMIAGTVIITLL